MWADYLEPRILSPNLLLSIAHRVQLLLVLLLDDGDVNPAVAIDLVSDFARQFVEECGYA
jgi:hypothetical protein